MSAGAHNTMKLLSQIQRKLKNSGSKLSLTQVITKNQLDNQQK